MAFRLDLGRLLLDAFFDSDLHAYGSRNLHREGRFADFFRQHHELERYGVSEAVALSCIKGLGVYRALLAGLRESTYFSQVLELTKLGDATARLRLAGAAIQQNGTVRRLRDAVHAVRAGAGPVEVAHSGAEEVAPPVEPPGPASAKQRSQREPRHNAIVAPE